MKDFDVAIYADTGRKALLSKETRDAIRLSPITTLLVNVERSDGSMVYTAEDLSEVVSAYPALRVRPVFWPKEDFDAGYVETVNQMCFVSGESPVLDKEHNWVGVNDGVDMASLYFMGPYRLTTHLGHELVRRPRTALAARLADELEVQALSVAKRKGKAVDPTGVLGPGHMQRKAVELGLETNGKKPFVTLPLYGQTGWGVEPVEAMEIAARACVKEGVPGISFWSLKHMMKISYALEFMVNRLGRILVDEGQQPREEE